MAGHAGGIGHDRILRFLRRCHRQLAIIADTDPARRGADALGRAIEGAVPVAFDPTSVPVLGTIDRVGTDPDPTGGLVADLIEVAPDLPWCPTPRSNDEGTALALAPLDRAFDLGDTIVGLMYVGPEATYPLHRHPPQELYLTIAGTGRWRYGGADGFAPVGPNVTVYNRPGDLHSAIAGPEPLVALYVLW